MSKSIMLANPATVVLDEVGSIPADWVISGQPETRSKILVRSHDWIAHVIVWECGAVSYKWHYNQDEAYIVLSGEGFMTDETGVERTPRGVTLITTRKLPSSRNPLGGR